MFEVKTVKCKLFEELSKYLLFYGMKKHKSSIMLFKKFLCQKCDSFLLQIMAQMEKFGVKYYEKWGTHALFCHNLKPHFFPFSYANSTQIFTFSL